MQRQARELKCYYKRLMQVLGMEQMETHTLGRAGNSLDDLAVGQKEDIYDYTLF